MNLSQEQKAQYDQLKKEIYELDSIANLHLNQVADKLGIPYLRAMKWFSHMLKFYSENHRPPDNFLCPSCGKEKNAVTDQRECRDFFHYI